MTAGQTLTIETIRIAAVLYVLSVAAYIERRDRPARILWSIACVFYLAHLVAAFDSFHHWSHTAAYLETARQTAQLFAIEWGGGLYFNYLFTLIWIADVLWWWRAGLAKYRQRRWIGAAVHIFMAFIFFNATVVFASGPTRWLGLAATCAILAMAARRRVG